MNVFAELDKMASGTDDLFEVFFNSEGLPDFIGQEFAAITSDWTSPSFIIPDDIAYDPMGLAEIKEEDLSSPFPLSPGSSSDYNSGAATEEEEEEMVVPSYPDAAQLRKLVETRLIKKESTAACATHQKSRPNVRPKKRDIIEELERKVTHMAAQNERLTQENKMLRDDLDYLASMLSRPESERTELIKQVSTPKNIRAAGVCLLIVLLSFGMLFNVRDGHPSGLISPINASSLPLPTLPALTDSAALATEEVVVPVAPETADAMELRPKKTRVKIQSAKKVDKTAASAAAVPATPARKRKQPPLKRARTNTNGPASSSSMVTPSVVATPTTTSAAQQQQPATVAPQLINAPNHVSQKSYLFCAEAREVVMTHEDAGLSGNSNAALAISAQPGSKMLSLLIPVEGFKGAADAVQQGVLSQELAQFAAAPQSALMEVTCAVVGVNVYNAAGL